MAKAKAKDKEVKEKKGKKVEEAVEIVESVEVIETVEAPTAITEDTVDETVDKAPEEIVEAPTEPTEPSVGDEVIEEYANAIVGLNTVLEDKVFEEVTAMLQEIEKFYKTIRQCKVKRATLKIHNFDLLAIKKAREKRVPKMNDGAQQALVKALQAIMKYKR